MVELAQKSHKHGSTTVGLRKRRQGSSEGGKPEVVRVRATDEKYRKALRHGVSGKRFLPDINQSVEWPNDTYTHRRLKEGSIVLDESPQQARREPAGRRRSEPREPTSREPAPE